MKNKSIAIVLICSLFLLACLVEKTEAHRGSGRKECVTNCQR